MRLGLARPARKLRQPASVRAARGIQVRDDHVIKQDVVQPPRRQLAANQVRMHVQDRHVGQAASRSLTIVDIPSRISGFTS